MRKIAVIVGSRANWGRLKSVCKAIDEQRGLELQIITAASGIDLPIYTPERIQCLVEGDNHQAMVLTTGLFLTQLGGALERLKPDMVLVHGDRYEMLAAATTAAYMNISLVHTEGGEVTGCIDDKVRYAITALADIHFPVTEASAKHIHVVKPLSEIHVVGSPALDTLVGIDLTNNRTEPYILVLHHPNTTHEENIEPLIEAVNNIPIHTVWVNPNVDAGAKAMLKQVHRQNVEFIKDLPPEEYARLLKNCQCAVGNSSSFIKEGAFLGVPAVLVGGRQEGREHGDNVVFAKNKVFSIEASIHYQLGNKPKPEYLFGDGTAGRKIAEILAGVNL